MRPTLLPLLLAATLLSGCPAEKCASGLTDCDGACVDLQVDAAHCGGCGQSCGLGTCSVGACTCDATATACAGSWPLCADLTSDAEHCGDCETSCVTSTGAACASSACTCPTTGATRKCTTTGTTGPFQTRCCEGTACCGDGSACQVKHSNGLGQSYFNCDPLGTYSLATAEQAAAAWVNTGSVVPVVGCNGSCIGVTVTSTTPNQCAVWCYSGEDAGKVTFNDIDVVCHCPPWQNQSTWN